MWIKSHFDIIKHIPEDNKWHDIQIINGLVWVDGELRNPSAYGFANFKLFNWALSKKETQCGNCGATYPRS